MSHRSIETEISTTAKLTCVSRAASSLETNSCYRSNDNIALLHIPAALRYLFRIHLFRKLFSRAIAPKGIYEYTIARTKYIDAVFEQVFQEAFNQILIFGAGFDSRAVRFQADLEGVKIFELDASVTQQAKIEQYRKLGITQPDNLIFIPIDFDQESLPMKLELEGFGKGKRCLFVLEGLLMYLQEDSIDETFQVIEDFAADGSIVVFDYVRAEVLRDPEAYYGGKEIVETVSKAGEKWTSGFEKDEIEPYLSRFGLVIREFVEPDELERRYFTDSKGQSVGRINGAHCLVKAVKMDKNRTA